MQQQRSDALVPPRWSCGSTWNGRLRPYDSVLGIPGARVGAGSQLTALLNGLKEPISVLLPPRHSSQLQQVSSGEHRRDGHAARPFLSWHLGQGRILAARDVPAPMAFRRSANCHDAIALVPPFAQRCHLRTHGQSASQAWCAGIKNISQAPIHSQGSEMSIIQLIDTE